MTLASGTVFGPYKIAALVGVGGMGEVYRASDIHLKRDVAIKVLPQSLANDPDRLARFQREAEVLASLNHPNIAHVYGLEHSDGATALVMELVPGETLAERIARSPMAVDEALDVARQIADALDAAHARGIVHRDLKPANVKLTLEGAVKVLDFGIAKALDARAPIGAESDRTASGMTQTGMVLGTPAYMSPEQAQGKPVDERTDVWAFGCLLYEMLAGRPAFPKDEPFATPTSPFARAAETDPLASIPPAVRRTIELCLVKDARKRIRHIADARLALDGAFETLAPSAAGHSPHSTRWRAAFAIAAAAIVALAVPTLVHLRETPPPVPPETRLDIATPPTDEPASFALSPDSRQIVFVATGENGSQLWLRSLASTKAEPLAGTQGAVSPFWSPDSRSVGFFTQGALKRFDLDGGAPRTLAPALNGAGGSWNASGVILFAPSLTSPVMRVSATGGEVTPVTTLMPQHIGHMGPNFLPDGERFLFFVSGPDVVGLYIGALDGSVSSRLLPADGDGTYLQSGWLLASQAGALMAHRFDLARGVLTGESHRVVDGLVGDWRFHRGISASRSGLIAYRMGQGGGRQLAWFDALGSPQGMLGDSDGANMSSPRSLPDGRAVVSRTSQGNYDLWLLDGVRTSRLTFDEARDDYPLVSPDGTAVVFRSVRAGSPGDLYVKAIDRADPEELLFHSDQLKVPTSWSADGRFLMYLSIDPQTNGDLWVLPMQGDRTPFVFLRTPFREVYGAFSPDGRWVAYHSNETGEPEVFVRPFVAPGEGETATVAAANQWQVSTDGGAFPQWRADGRMLYYLDPTGAMMAVPISVVNGRLSPGTPEELFQTRISRGGRDIQQGRQYEVAADGRFLLNVDLAEEFGTPITLLQNWGVGAAAGD